MKSTNNPKYSSFNIVETPDFFVVRLGFMGISSASNQSPEINTVGRLLQKTLNTLVSYIRESPLPNL